MSFDNMSKEELISKIKEMNVIRTTWEDYMYLLLNSTPNPLRDIWREKIVKSITHWKWGEGSISEGNFAGLELLSELPNELTEAAAEYHLEEKDWDKHDRLARSKRINVTIGIYPMESLSEMARKSCVYLIENFDKWGHLIGDNNYPGLNKIWDFAQRSGGECILPDEVLTYILENKIDDSVPQSWIQAADSIFSNGHTELYAKYYKHDKLEGYPFEVSEDVEVQKKNFLEVVNVIFKEDVSWAPCFKKICICILKNDCKLGYCGFGETLKEKLAREESMQAFETNKEKERMAKLEAEKMAAEIEAKNKKD